MGKFAFVPTPVVLATARKAKYKTARSTFIMFERTMFNSQLICSTKLKMHSLRWVPGIFELMILLILEQLLSMCKIEC